MSASGVSRRGVALVLVGLAVLTALALGIWLGGRGTQGGVVTAAGRPLTVERDQLAPLFRLTTLDGVAMDLADTQGDVVLVNFWATWCGPCEAEMPAIQDRYKTFHEQGLTVLAVNLAEAAADVRAFVERLGLTFTILMDPSETVFNQYRVQGYPTSFFIDRQGVIQNVRVGYMADDLLDQYLLDAGFGSQ